MRGAWRLVVDGERHPAWNMAVDRALLESGEGSIFRIYGWNPSGLSIGYFQEAPPEDPGGLVVVRRPTGGGAIVHRRDATFSLAGASDDPVFARGQRATYEFANEVVARALGSLGVEARPRGCERRRARVARDPAAAPFAEIAAKAANPLGRTTESFLCFERAGAHDLVVDGRKVVGTAQRRTRKRCLLQGSIAVDRIEPEPDRRLLITALARAFAESTGGVPIECTLTSQEEAAAGAMARPFSRG